MINPAALYLITLQSGVSRATMASRLNFALSSLALADDYESFDWRQLDSTLIYNIRNWLQKNDKAPSSIKNYLAAFKGVAREAFNHQVIDVETYMAIQNIKSVRGSRAPVGRSLSIDELNQMIDHCMIIGDEIGVRDATIISLMYGCGLRRQEAAKLTLAAFNQKKQSLTIVGKGNKERVIPLHPRIIDILQTWLSIRGNDQGRLFLRIYKGGHLSDKPMSDHAIYSVIIRRYKEAGLESLTPHDLRKSFATLLLENGEDIFTVQELMGHDSVDTTRKYDKRGEKNSRKAIKALPL